MLCTPCSWPFSLALIISLLRVSFPRLTSLLPLTHCTRLLPLHVAPPTQHPVYDFYFDAMNTFRFIGYLLATSIGQPCPALWDPSNPREWKYGPYRNVLCKPIPARGSQ